MLVFAPKLETPPPGMRVLPFTPGVHLTSIVFPDSDTYLSAVKDERISAHLARAGARVNLYLLEELDHL